MSKLRVVAGLSLLGVGLLPLGATEVAAAEPATVTIASGPTTEEGFLPACSDAVHLYDEATSFVVTRDQPTGELTVSYAESGTAQPGVHYAALPGEIVFADGESIATIELQPLTTAQPALVELTLTLEASPEAAIGDPAGATVRFATAGDPTGTCPWTFRFTEAPQNTHQELTVGAALASFEIEYVETGSRVLSFRSGASDGLLHWLQAGALPPGVALACADGSPVDPAGAQAHCESPYPQGTATTPGTYASVIEVCTAGIVRHCETTELTVVVHAAPTEPALPMTGGRPSTLTASLVALLVSVGLLGLLRASRSPA